MNTQRDRAVIWLPRTWPLMSAPRAAVLYLLAVDLVAVVASLRAALPFPSLRNDLPVFLLLVTLALVYEESARRPSRLKLRLTTGIRRDMTSVWAVAAAVALSPGHGALLLFVIMGYVWFRQQRPAGQVLHLKVFNMATAVLGCLVAGAVFRTVSEAVDVLPLALERVAAILFALLAYTVANRLLVTVGGLVLGMRLGDLVGSRDDNMIELATLCLGGLVAAAVAYEPWSAVFVIAPMLALQRGSVVRQLETAAITDAKTGLLNAVAWEQLAQRELARAGRVGSPLAVLIIDIDRFKSVNDRYGHLVGDKVLAGVARSIESALREYDGLGRFGGEEFVAVLPDAGEHDALVVAERVRLRVNELTVAGITHGPEDASDDSGNRLSISVGVAVRGAPGSELTDLLHAADQALYRAKWNGRNQVQLARRGDELPEIVKL